jgi:hypothetical protein
MKAQGSERTPPLLVALRLLLGLVSSALTIYCLFMLRSGILALTSLALSGQTGVTPRYQARFIDIVSTLLLGIGAIAFIIFLEHWFRTGEHKGLLAPRFIRATGILILLLCVSHATTWIATGGGVNLGLAAAGVELVVGLALVLVPRFLRARKARSASASRAR